MQRGLVSLVYVFCAFVTHSDVSSYRDKPASFDLKDGRLVTSDWLEACIAYDEIPIDNPLVDVLKRPLRCALPLACTKDTMLSVAYSGFDHDFDRPKLVNLLNTLGKRICEQPTGRS